jgi:hypothetical protein
MFVYFSKIYRDLEEDLYPHFNHFFGILMKQMDAVAYSGSSIPYPLSSIL